MRLVPQTRLGAYEIVALIGSGGMGEVYQARDLRLDRIVALKVMTGGGSADADLMARFEREARAISSLNHPHICVLHDVGRERPLPPASGGTSDAASLGAEDAQTAAAQSRGGLLTGAGCSLRIAATDGRRTACSCLCRSQQERPSLRESRVWS